MHLALIPVQDGESTISRLVVKSVVDDLIRLTGITKLDDVIYAERRGVTHTYTNSQNQQTDPHLRLETGSYLIVEYSESPDSKYNLRKDQMEYPSIFANKDIGVYVTPQHLKNVIEINFKMRSTSYGQLSTWLNKIRYNRSTREPYNYHRLLYNYTLPQLVVAYLYDTWALTESVEPYGRTLTEYNEAFYTKGIMGRMNSASGHKSVTINNLQTAALGYFTDIPERVETDGDKGYAEIDFTYKLHYERAYGVVLSFQKFIHNQQVDKVYCDAVRIPDNPPADNIRGMPNLSHGVVTVTEDVRYRQLPFEKVFMDDLDKWYPTYTNLPTSTIAMMPVKLPDDLNPRFITISGLNVPVFQPWIQTVLDVTAILPTNSLVTYGESPFLLELYRHNSSQNSLGLVQDGDILEIQPTVSLRDRHYLRISVMYDLTKCYQSLRKLLGHPQLLLDVIRFVFPRCSFGDGEGMLELIANGQRVTEPSLKRVIGYISLTNPQYKTYQGIHRTFLLIQETNVEVHKNVL